jgi:hypothetical protein
MSIDKYNLRLGAISKFITPNYGQCETCQTTWFFVEPHIKWISRNEGYFTQCVKCYSDSGA